MGEDLLKFEELNLGSRNVLGVSLKFKLVRVMISIEEGLFNNFSKQIKHLKKLIKAKTDFF